MDPAPGDVCLDVGSDQLLERDGVPETMHTPRDFFAPWALNSVYREVARFLHFKRATQTMGGHLVRFDLLRKKDEAGADWRIFPDGARLKLLRSGRIPCLGCHITGSFQRAGGFKDCRGGKADGTSIRPNGRRGAAGRSGGDGDVGRRRDSLGGQRLRCSDRLW